MPDVNSTIIVDVQINQGDANARAQTLLNTISNLKDQQKLLTDAGQKNTVAYQQLSQQITQTTAQAKAYVSMSQTNTTSGNALSAQLKILTAQYNSLTEEEKKNTEAGKALTTQTLDIKNKLNESNAAIGNNTGKVGGYEEAITSALAKQIPFGNEIIETAEKANSLSAAFGGTGIAAGFLSAGLTAVGLAAVAAGAYLEQFTPFMNALKQETASLWQAFVVLGDAIRTNNYNDLISRMDQAGSAAKDLTADLQKLKAEMSGDAVTSAFFEAKISELTLAMRNRRNTPAQEEDYFKKIQDISEKNYSVQLEDAQKFYNNAYKLAVVGKEELTQKERDSFSDIKNIKSARAAYELEEEGKINEGTANAIAEGQKMLVAAELYKTQADQRAQNFKDRQDLRLEKQAQELQRHLDEINADRAKSELITSQSIITIRNKELIDINGDIDKREALWKKYGVDTEQLEKERLVRLRTLRDKFTQEDLKIIATNNRSATLSNIKSGKQTFGSGSVTQQVANQQNVFDLTDVDREIEEVKKRVTNGERGLNEVLQSYINKRKAIQAAGSAADLKTDQDLAVQKTTQQKQANDEILRYDIELLKQQQDVNAQRLELNAQLAASYESMFGTISQIAGKASTVGIVAFTIEKGLAIAQIAINAEKARSAATAAYYERLAWDAIAGPFGIGLAVADTAIYGAQIAQITTGEIASIATIAAQTIATDITGHAQGGPISGPGSGTSDSIPARLSNGEFVMTARATQMFAPLLHSMNTSAGGKGFASGGLAGSFVPTLTNQAKSDNAITRSISSINMKPTVYVEDINYAQDKYAVNVEAGNF